MYQVNICILLGLVLVVACQPPSYSSRYAKVSYQPQINEKLKNSQREKEEVTEKPNQAKKSPQDNNSGTEVFSSAEIIGVTTEKESEQINFARFTHTKSLKDKLELESDTEPDIDEIVTITAKYEENEAETEKHETIKENIETLEDDFPESEIDDLNQQGVYYILHPNGLFQKVVYKTQDQPVNMQVSTQVHYQNVEPIIEPIYTYDPRTFVFQRLLLTRQSEI